MFDVVVIGGGPGGYVAAIRAAQLGMQVSLIEEENLGGICLNWGCIPTKALLRSADIYRTLQHADDFGFNIDGKIKIDFKKIIQRSREVSKTLSSGIDALMKKNNITVIKGRGKIVGTGLVSISNANKKTDEIQAKNIILATGARARILPGFEPDDKLIWTYREAMVPTTLPKSLLIVGSGAIGMEFASFYSTLGTKVTVAEVAPRILLSEDEEIAKQAHASFEAQGIDILTSIQLNSCKKNKNEVEVNLTHNDKKQKINVERVIIAAGIVGNIEDLGLEHTKVAVERSHIITDEFCETSEKGIFAIGDVASTPWLAHKASHEAIICINNIANPKNKQMMKKSNIPGCIYSHPQIASVGLKESEAIEAGYEINIGKFPFVANGKAIAMAETEGMVKTIFDKKTGELLGAHMIGSEVTEMIQGYCIARQLETTHEDLMHTIFPHPTLSEMMHESVLDAYSQALHK